MKPKAPLKILLGGVPLGCDNIGDEAILATVVSLFRSHFPDALLTVCTADPVETKRRLSVECAPLYGFQNDLSMSGFRTLVAQHDLFCWCGATGLSDYPAAAMTLLETAFQEKIPAIVWGVGMDSTFNPSFFKAGGKRKKLLELLSFFFMKKIDFKALYETFLIQRIRKRIRETLSRASLVVLRDPESGKALSLCGFTDFIIGADTAILLPTSEKAVIRREQGIRKIGFCISAQRMIRNSGKMTALWERLLNKGYHLVFLPMNPKTDRDLMKKLSISLDSSRMEWVETAIPEEIQSAAASCDVLVSSRLHLLILGGNVLTPLVGIERGSKLSNYLANFGLSTSGTVDECDFVKMESEIERFCGKDEESFRQKAQSVRKELLSRLRNAEEALVRTVNAVSDRNI